VTPVETLWFGLIIVFAVAGIVRGFLRELGVTLVLIVMLFGLTRLSGYFPKALDLLTNTLRLPIRAWVDRDAVWLIFYLVLVGSTVFASYQGYVIKYPGSDPHGLQGSLLGLLIGTINGYLAVGTIWYYVDKFKAPVKALGLLQYDYTLLAQRLVKILPPDLLNPYLPFLVVFMIILLVLK